MEHGQPLDKIQEAQMDCNSTSLFIKIGKGRKAYDNILVAKILQASWNQLCILYISLSIGYYINQTFLKQLKCILSVLLNLIIPNIGFLNT